VLRDLQAKLMHTQGNMLACGPDKPLVPSFPKKEEKSNFVRLSSYMGGLYWKSKATIFAVLWSQEELAYSVFHDCDMDLYQFMTTIACGFHTHGVKLAAELN
jgi:hypothetical protein